MNKTIIININGIVFHIEEDAYEVLKNYITDVKRHFLNSADSLEITTDIENRIAEMFAEILTRDNKQVIVEADVKTVIAQMGTVEDFEHADEEPTAQSQADAFAAVGGTRTLFRDPDYRIIAGVASGLGNYFNISAIWFRLLFAVLAPFGGLGIILYIILWIVVPKAITRADRMAMKGQKLTLQGFKNNFEEEMSAVKGQLSNLKNESKPFIYRFRDLLGELFFHIGRFFRGTGKVLFKILSVLILLTFFGFAVAMVISLAAILIWNTGPVHMFPFSIVNNEYSEWMYISIFLVAFVPVLAIILLILKAVFNTESISRSSGVVLLTVWLFAVSTGLYYGSKISKGFRSTASFTQTSPLAKSSNNKYYLTLNDVMYLTGEDSSRLDIKKNFNGTLTYGDEEFEKNEPRNVQIRIEKADVDRPVLVQTYRSKGSSYEDALFNARNTRYIFTQQDSVLKFDKRLQRVGGATWHDQEIELTLKVPVNAVVVINDEFNWYINDGVDYYSCNEINKSNDNHSAEFIMTVNGLECKVDTSVVAKPDSLKRVK
ncbi:PspC domain-containing protein [Mucilaginibacter auburnensis]|uniref:Phage shock protein PspC (Stress-responsive transcriptional regulator) n=1 Tax=Mucilaginibacter auburnensis TaxID=1457233 RepID=A0A2H9VRR4_9SPHI|nr:PspC domain-containing protein [Mucilaginibacter auburnensis]PJJ83502.1 phage shock protein PspC (stress-responsive transcriptional regulator) [Mucilaginibacter auburnensis]